MTISKQDIIKWIASYSKPIESPKDIEQFSAALNEQISQMDFRAVKI